MNWVDVLLFLGALLGLSMGAFMVARSPKFWIGMGEEVFKKMLPILTKRMTPEEEAAFQACNRRNGKWNHLKKRCE